MTATAWRKSKRSGNSGANCVETRKVETVEDDGVYQVRDSKLDEESPIFDLAPRDFEGLLRAAR